MHVTYSVDALIYNAGAGTWTLRADFNPAVHRVNIQFTDDDDQFDGDEPWDEVGYDANQTAVVTDMVGNPVASGQVYNEEYYEVSADGGSTFGYIDVVEISGTVVGFMVDVPLTPGVANTIFTNANVTSSSTMGYSAYSQVPCFGPGTMIATSDGELPIEWLVPGDKILTRDHGAQPLRNLQRQAISPMRLKRNPELHPIEAQISLLTGCMHNETLALTQNHRVLMNCGPVDYLFGQPEVICAAGHLFERPIMPQHTSGIKYFHLILDRHELVLANGYWCESLFCPPDAGFEGIAHKHFVRPELKFWEAQLLKRHLWQPKRKLSKAA